MNHNFPLQLMLKLIKIMTSILGSGWFIPVSFMSGLFLGTYALSYWDARNVQKGDTVHSVFGVAVVPGKDNKPFRLISLSEIPKLRQGNATYSFLMPKPYDHINVNNYASVSYKVIEEKASEQLIEVIDKSDDNTIWSRYRATKTDVTPISSRMFYFGYMFTSLPFALALAFFICWVGRHFRRKFNIHDARVTP